MSYKNMGTSFFRFITRHAFDRQTDRQTDRKAFAIPCVALHAVAQYKLWSYCYIWSHCSWLAENLPCSGCCMDDGRVNSAWELYLILTVEALTDVMRKQTHLLIYLLTYSDVNECATNNGGCEGVCNNTIGSYNCQCAAGFHLANNSRNCVG